MFFAAVLTWDFVIYRGIAIELSSGPARLIFRYGTLGLLISVVGSLTLFIAFWVEWVLISQSKKKSWRHFLALSGSLAGSLIFSIVYFIDFVHDLLIFGGFRTTILLSLLRDSSTMILFLVLFSIGIAYIKTFRLRR